MIRAALVLAALLATTPAAPPDREIVNPSAWLNPCTDTLVCAMSCASIASPGWVLAGAYSDGVRCHCIWTRSDATRILSATSTISCRAER